MGCRRRIALYVISISKMLKLHFNEHSKFTIIEKINNASLLKQQRQSLLEQI